MLDADSHIFNYEGAGAAVFGGVQTLPVKTARGFLTPEQVREHIRPNNIHIPMTGLVAVENTHNRHGGTYCTPEEIEAVAAAAHAAGVPVHLDGARASRAVALDGPRDFAPRRPLTFSLQGPRRPCSLRVRLARAVARAGGAEDAGRRCASGVLPRRSSRSTHGDRLAVTTSNCRRLAGRSRCPACGWTGPVLDQ